MKFVFIINPAAGGKNASQLAREEISRLTDIEYEIHETTAPLDATEYVRKACRENPEEKFCFVACGGDGTLNEVANGAYGQENACISVYPVGSGNDYVKCLGGAGKFLNLEKLVKGVPKKVDLLKIGERYAINAVHFGLDAVVLRTMIKVKRKPLIGGRNAYYTGVLAGMFKGLNNKGYITADGRKVNDGNYMMCTICNGTHVGGSFYSAPRSVVDDGLAEICCFRVVPKLRIPFLIGKYINGVHLEDKECLKYLTYCRAKTVELENDEPFDISVDGELVTGSHFTVETLEKAITMIVPCE